MPFPQSTAWGHLGTRNAAQLAVMNPAEFAGQSLFLNGDRLLSYFSDGVDWILETQSAGAVNYAASSATDPIATEANRANIQAKIDATELLGGGVISLTTPGICYISRAVLLGDNCYLYIGLGVTLKLRDGADPLTNTGYCVVGNKQAFTTIAGATTVANGLISWGNTLPGDSNTYHALLTNANSPGIQAKHPAGTYISAVVTGHFVTGAYPTGSATRAAQNSWFRGVYKVGASGDTSLRYITTRSTPQGPGSNQNTAYLYRANVNVGVFGPGTIDGNGANQAATNDRSGKSLSAGNPRANVMWFRHVFGLTLDGFEVKRGRTWTIGTNYVRNYLARDIRGDLRDPAGGSSIDGLHLVGQHQNVVIDLPMLFSEDNTVGMTQDITDDTAISAGLTFNFDFQAPGDHHSVHVVRAGCDTLGPLSSGFALIAFWGAPGYRFFSPVIDNVTGQGGPLVSLANYPTTGLTQTTIDILRINGLNGVTSSGAVQITGLHRIDSLIIDGVTLPGAGPVGGALTFPAGTGTPTIGTLVVSNVVSTRAADGTPAPRTSAVIQLGSASIGSATFNDIGNVLLNTDTALTSVTNVPLISHSGSGVIGSVTLNRCNATCSAINATSLATTSALYSSEGSTALCGSLTFNDCTMNGVSYLGTLNGNVYKQGVAALYPVVIFNNSTVNGGAAVYSGGNASATVNVFFNDQTLRGTQSARLAVLTGNVNVNVNGYAEITAPANNPFQTANTATTFTFRVQSSARVTDLIEKGAASLIRMVGSIDAKTDGDKVTVSSAVVGDTFWNTNAASTFGSGVSKIGYYGCTVAGTTFVKIFGPA